MNKHWQILSKKSDNIIEQILLNRKISRNDWDSFLNPSFEKLFEPFLMKGMKEAVEKVSRAYIDKETIGIFSDYDADGIPGAALLFEFLTKIGLEVKIYIPRRDQGYGLNREGIETLKKEGVKLLIAIDLGSRNIQEVNFALKNGLEVIILDHHEMAKDIPAGIILNPKQKGDSYPFKELAATGVVFKFIQAINQKLKKVSLNYLKWTFDLVAISTICDVVPLISENRIFAKFGLIVLQKTKRLGLKALYQRAAILPEKIDTYSVGFQIGPRLNAPGRMNYANESFYLLVSKNHQEAEVLARKLDLVNRRRQNELERVLKEAKEKVSKRKLDKNKIILVEGKNWPQGIVGLVAGKLMEEFARPVIVCEEKDGKLRGSARSIDAYNMVEALDEAQEYLTKYGGHKKAAGLSLELEHLSDLYDKLLEIAESKLKDEDLKPKITVDAKINIDDINLKLVDSLGRLAPFGFANPRPVFQLASSQVSDIRTVGKENNHLKFKVEGISAIGFDLGDRQSELRNAKKIDLVFTLDEDNWDGTRKVQLKVLDLKIL